MQRIPLTKGAYALVDDRDHAYLCAVGRWCLNSYGYAVHYARPDHTGQRRVLYMHRLVAGRVHGPLGHFQVDHVNRDKLDNRRENLRLATRSQNQANQSRRANNTTGQRGVSWRAGRYEARIRFQGQRIHLGRYLHAEDAAHAYGFAARTLYGDFAGDDLPADPTPDDVADKVRLRLRKVGAVDDSKKYR